MSPNYIGCSTTECNVKIFLILQCMITASCIRVYMVEPANLTGIKASHAAAKSIILEKPAIVSIIAMRSAVKVHFLY